MYKLQKLVKGKWNSKYGYSSGLLEMAVNQGKKLKGKYRVVDEQGQLHWTKNNHKEEKVS
jgi:hypothetical protein